MAPKSARDKKIATQITTSSSDKVISTQSDAEAQLADLNKQVAVLDVKISKNQADLALAKKAGTVATVTVASGTIGAISGTGPYNAVITGISSTTGFSVGQVLSATNGTGSFGSGSMTVITVPSGGVSLGVSSTASFTQGTVTQITALSISGIQKDLATNQNSRNDLASQRDTLATKKIIKNRVQEQGAATAAAAAADKITTTAIGNYGAITKKSSLPLLYNASTVKESYFSGTAGYQLQKDPKNPNKLVGLMHSSNKPSAVAAATELWTSASGSKGMIVTAASTVAAWNSGSNKPKTADVFDSHNYGFQFMYNPGTVNMSYFTSPNIDVTMMSSGQEMFNLAGVATSQGSIGFQVIINRIADMQYFNSDGTLIKGAEQNYSKPPSSVQDQKDLYNRGTMYDVEYLLRVLMGTTMSSYLRGTKTADMGWLPAIPVELHLGKSLRYLGVVNNFNLNHIIFNEKMVPLFTTMDISFARLPDYPPASNTPDKTPPKKSRAPISGGQQIYVGGGTPPSGDYGDMGVGGGGAFNELIN
jgi:hypothetical protein